MNGVTKTHRNNDHVYVDTCASADLFILSDSDYFFNRIDGVIGLTAAGAVTDQYIMEKDILPRQGGPGQ